MDYWTLVKSFRIRWYGHHGMSWFDLWSTLLLLSSWSQSDGIIIHFFLNQIKVYCTKTYTFTVKYKTIAAMYSGTLVIISIIIIIQP